MKVSHIYHSGVLAETEAWPVCLWIPVWAHIMQTDFYIFWSIIPHARSMLLAKKSLSHTLWGQT